MSFAAAIFTGAFLLFLVQPLIGKYILPWFGGSPAVWTTCLVFFQCGLLAGYAYAHLLTRWLRPRRQVGAHLVLLAVAVALLPITPGDQLRPDGEAEPTGEILVLLGRTIGLPYLALSATGPLMQAWFGRVHPGRSPYRLYALSNLGSLLALLSYPVLVETTLPRPDQTRWWSAGLAVFALACAWCGVRLWRTPDGDRVDPAPGVVEAEEAPGPGRVWLWLLLPAGATILLMATTNKICQDIFVVPFLWVLPLGLYLLTFILSFDRPGWYSRAWYARALLPCWGAVGWVLGKGVGTPLTVQLAVYSATLFVTCMICHGELYRLKPAPRQLTAYYLTIAGGGALGGLLVALGAPVLFDSYRELHWGLVASGVLFTVVCFLHRSVWAVTRGQVAIAGLASGVVAGWALFRHIEVPGAAHAGFGLGALGLAWDARYGLAIGGGAALLTAICFVWICVRPGLRWNLPGWIPLSLAVSVLAGGLWQQAIDADAGAGPSVRNFHGVLTLFEYDADDPPNRHRLLRHGRITHGLQFTDPEHARRPTTYYGEKSGVGRAIRVTRAPGQRVGVVGLGVGTIATYGRPGDYYRFYEINPEVVRLSGPAGDTFTYLMDSEATVEVALGDARLSMEREPPQQFDVLALDAFSSDAIPVHLLTREAFEVYRRHLRPDGIIAVHIANRYLDLEPVVLKAARHLEMRALILNGHGNDENSWTYASAWVLLTGNQALVDHPDLKEAVSAPKVHSPDLPMWTDDYTSIFGILQDTLVSRVREFVSRVLSLAARFTGVREAAVPRPA